PVGGGRGLMQPMVAARLLQAAAVQPKDAALLVGAGVGYEAAVLSLLARSVVALEENPELARIGRSALVDHGIASVSYVEAPLASAQTLAEACTYGYTTNPRLLAQRASLGATDEGGPQALANWRPTVTFSANAGFNRAGFEQRNAANQPTPTQFSSFVSR